MTLEQPSSPPAGESIPQLIQCVRGQRVMLDADLARIYGVQTRALNQAIKRNLDRFPGDFILDLRACLESSSGKGLRARRGGWRGAPRAHIRKKSVTEAQRSQPPRPAARPPEILSKHALSREEILRTSQSVMSLRKLRFSKRVRAFTEHGAVMAAMVLGSPRAVAMSVYVVRAFIKMREDLAANALILRRLAEIDKTLLVHDAGLRDIYQKLRPLLEPPPLPPKPQIGFHLKEDALPYRARRRAEPTR